MPTTKEQLKNAITELLEEGKDLAFYEQFIQRKATSDKPESLENKHKKQKKETEPDIIKELLAKKPYKNFGTAYQIWFSQAAITLKQIMPERYEEFVECYRPNKNRKELNLEHFAISDFFNGVTLLGWNPDTPFNMMMRRLTQQIAILEACLVRLDSILADIKGVLQAEMFDDELSAARELMKKGHLRAAGALTGVTLERHFATVALNRGIVIKKKDPTIADYNEEFKKEGIYDVPTWRKIQSLGDTRNLASHFKKTEPTEEDIDDMLKGTEKILKTVF